MLGLRLKQPLQQQSLSAWLVFLLTVIVYMCGMTCSVVVLWWTILLIQFY